MKPRHTLAILSTSIISSLSFTAIPVLDGVGFYFEEYTGVLARLAIFVLFALSLMLAIIGAVVARTTPMKKYAPVTLHVLVVVLVFGVNVGRLAAKRNFEARLDQRLAVVDMIEKGQLQETRKGPCNCHYAELPDGYRQLSAGQEILIARHDSGISVTFFVARWGVFPDDDYTAFIYRTVSGEPTTGVEDTDHFTRIEQLAPNWFLVEHT